MHSFFTQHYEIFIISTIVINIIVSNISVSVDYSGNGGYTFSVKSILN